MEQKNQASTEPNAVLGALDTRWPQGSRLHPFPLPPACVQWLTQSTFLSFLLQLPCGIENYVGLCRTCWMDW